MESSCKFVVVLRLLTLLMFCDCIMGDVNSGSIYSLLSHVIFEMKANFEKIEKRMEIMEDRLARVEITMSTVAKTSDISTIGPNHGKDLIGDTNSQALFIKKTLFVEKKILREAMHSFAQNFSDFKSEILTEISTFTKALNMDISTINASLESKEDKMINRLDSSSMTLANEVIELTSCLNSTTSKISHVLEEVRSSIEGVEQRITAVENEQKIDGGWNAWEAWTSCTATCNSGLKTRQRQCANPRPSGGGQYCDGANIDVVQCNQNPCPKIDGGWNAWEAWTSCTATCNSGLKTRQRQCANPRPSGGGQYCDGANIDVVQCNQNPCPRPSTSSLDDSGTFKLNVTHLIEYGKIRWMTYGNSSIIPQDDYGCLLVKMGGKYLVLSRFTFNIPADFNTTAISHSFTLLDNVGKNKAGGFRRIYDAKKGQRSPSVFIEVLELAPEEQICVSVTRPDLLYISRVDNDVNLVKV